ncbi:MAG: crossover junction endodeoxyribonuclease RuvC [Pseudomonadota bacterium]
MASVIRILGIDPGSVAMGWGVIDCDGPRASFVAAGTLRPGSHHAGKTAKVPLGRAEKLAKLMTGLNAVLAQYAPDEAGVEETFVNANPRDALVLGQARGIALVAPAMAQIPVFEYAANKIKNSVVGRGHADKTQVQAMVRVLLPSSGIQKPDAADALAVALCHAHHREAHILQEKMRVHG